VHIFIECGYCFHPHLFLHFQFFTHLYHEIVYGYNERKLTTFIVCVYLQLTEELTREYGISEDASAKITATYLKQFRKCPDNVTLTLDAWRTILWSKALGHKYSHLAKKVYERWLYLRLSGDLPWEKPEAEIFQKACHSLNVRPEECIMVGDKLETDILGRIFRTIIS